MTLVYGAKRISEREWQFFDESYAWVGVPVALKHPVDVEMARAVTPPQPARVKFWHRLKDRTSRLPPHHYTVDEKGQPLRVYFYDTEDQRSRADSETRVQRFLKF